MSNLREGGIWTKSQRRWNGLPGSYLGANIRVEERASTKIPREDCAWQIRRTLKMPQEASLANCRVEFNIGRESGLYR